MILSAFEIFLYQHIRETTEHNLIYLNIDKIDYK